jgi:hypothetical protein
LELVAENTSRTVRGRVEISDDDEDDRERINRKLFGDGDSVPDRRWGEKKKKKSKKRDITPGYDEDEASGSEVSEDQFIVHDEVEQVKGHRRRRGGKSKVNDQFIEDAREVFGVENIDFYLEDGRHILSVELGNVAVHTDPDSEEYEEEGEAEEGEEGAVVTKRPEKVSLLSTIEPAELAMDYFEEKVRRWGD